MQDIDKILDKLQKIEISIAVTHEKISQLSIRLENASKEFSALEKEFKTIEKRIDNHDKIVGAVVIAVAILGAMVKFKLI